MNPQEPGVHPGAPPGGYGQQQNPYGHAPQPHIYQPGPQQPQVMRPMQPTPNTGQGPDATGVDGFFSSVATNYIGSQFLQGGQNYVQRVQQKMGWFSGSVLNYYFAISREYVWTKLLILLAPYLKRWNYSRMPEQIPGPFKYRPPRGDYNCPDLYIPSMAFFTYCWLACLSGVSGGKFSPDLMYERAYRGLVGWIILFLVLKVIVYAMALPSALPVLEAVAYSGYVFVPLSIMALASLSGVTYAPTGAWLYSSLCMAVFLVRSLKRMIYEEGKYYGTELSRYNYLLLLMAVAQFPFTYFMGV